VIVGRPIFVDLDQTLIDSDVDGLGNVTAIYPRPGVGHFLGKLSGRGDLFLLTHAERPHVKNAFRAIGKPAKLFQGVISREDMSEIVEQIEYIFQDPKLTDEERRMIYQEIQPIMPRGYVFDDQPIGSELYLIKAAAVGARPSDWVQVKAFKRNGAVDHELERAYQEYLRRSMGSRTILSGRARRVTG
jgi:hypothetical protein